MPGETWTSLLRLADQGETFHVIDTETTGLSPRGDRVIELATVTLRHGAIVNRFETFIDPAVSVPPRITEITGITDRMLVGAPAPGLALRQWLAYLGDGGHFVAHNAAFDWDFLACEFERAQLDWPFKRRFCTVQLSRHCLPGLRRHRLENLIAHFGIEVSDRHRALADVEATAAIFLKFLDHLRAELPAPLERQVAAMPAGGSREVPETAWDALLAYVKARSLTTGALLDQHASLSGWEPDGALVIAITPVYHDHLSRQEAKRTLVEAAIQEVLGPDAYLRVEARGSGNHTGG